jgi:Flp pilus assembly protein CpaB
MKTARIVVLGIALSAGGVAAWLASGANEPKAPVPEPVAQLPTVDVLIAKSDIGLGQIVKPEDMAWQTWPAATASGSFIKKTDRPDAQTQPEVVISEVILSNIRVLAIDQAPKEKDGQTNLVGKTATLELQPSQAETLARARQMGILTLALRSIVDAKREDTKANDQSLVIVYRGADRQTYSCNPSCASR